jgi:hypothetical protein
MHTDLHALVTSLVSTSTEAERHAWATRLAMMDAYERRELIAADDQGPYFELQRLLLSARQGRLDDLSRIQALIARDAPGTFMLRPRTFFRDAAQEKS